MHEIAKYPGSAMSSRSSLAAKLYSIFALFAVLVAVITALSDYNTRQNAEWTEAVATASRAALNVERQFAGLRGRDGIARRLRRRIQPS
jgi:methyl-accepting chemotaxis protein